MPDPFQFPGKCEAYLATLSQMYRQRGEDLLQRIVVNGVISVEEGCDYDNWNGGMHGHAITLALPEDIFVEAMERRDDLQRSLLTDLNDLNSVQSEYVSEVKLEMIPANLDGWREASGVLRPRSGLSPVTQDAITRIWGDGRLRVFLSHKARIKVETSKLKESLAELGIASFVAHEDIQPDEEWQREIRRALQTMDALVALLTEDFHASYFTDHEVGFAMGRGVPLIAVRLGSDPYGLIGHKQGLGGCSLDRPDQLAEELFGVLYKRLSDKSALFESALKVYRESRSFDDSSANINTLLAVFDTLTATQVNAVLDAYRGNSQNRHSGSGRRALMPLLKKWTGDEWHLDGNDLVPVRETVEPQVPF